MAQTEFETRRELLRAAEASVGSARADVQRAEAALIQAGGPPPQAAVELRSPITGVVLERQRESEAIVPPGEPLLSVGDPAELEIVADFLSADAVRIAPGQQVQIEHWGGDRPLRGEVRLIEPSGFTKISALGVEEQRVNVIVDFVDPRELWQELGHGYRVTVRVVVWHGEDVLAVPTSSLFRRDGAWEVFVLEEGRARRRAVDIGHRNPLLAEVLAGVEAGQAVVAYPGDRVEDGVAIEPRQASR